MKRIALLVLILLLIPATLFASEIILKEDTDLHPQGWIAGSLKFKSGTKVILNENGEVVSGILSGYWHWLAPVGKAETYSNRFGTSVDKPNMVWYRGDIAPVVFNKRGQVLSGALAERTSAVLLKDAFPSVDFLAGKVLAFREDGSVESGTILEDTYFKTAATGKFAKYKGRSEVTFNEKGEVTSGQLVQ